MARSKFELTFGSLPASVKFRRNHASLLGAQREANRVMAALDGPAGRYPDYMARGTVAGGVDGIIYTPTGDMIAVPAPGGFRGLPQDE